MPYARDDDLSGERSRDGASDGVRADMFEYGDSGYKEYSAGQGADSGIHSGDSGLCVDCRAEAFAAKNSVVKSAFDGIGIGLGFTASLTVIGLVREFIGSGRFFGVQVYPDTFGTMIFVLAPGAFIVLSYLLLLFNRLIRK